VVGVVGVVAATVVGGACAVAGVLDALVAVAAGATAGALPLVALPHAAARSAAPRSARMAVGLIGHLFVNFTPTSCSLWPSRLRATICAMQVSPHPRRRRSLSRLVMALDRLSPWWGPQLVVAAALGLDFVLPPRLTVGHTPTWLLPTVEGVLLLALVVASPHPNVRHSPLRRRIAIGLIGLISAVNAYSLVQLCRYLLSHGTANGRELIFSGIALWATNVLLFGLWYFELDRGGPDARLLGEEHYPDFLFVQMTDAARFAPEHWAPRLLDYLYTSLTNATAFSPTDTMPLTAAAKWLMGAQALTSFVTIGLIVARAVNILH
jgi:hypothetical protein